jgi:hypothetical protein
MSTSGTELREAFAQSVSVGDDALVVDLADWQDDRGATRMVFAPGTRDRNRAHQLASHCGRRGNPLAGTR